MITKSIPKDFIDLRESPIDVHEIEMNVRDFYLFLNSKSGTSIKSKCLDARMYLSNAINLTKSLILPEENAYIKKYMKAYFWMIDNMGRASKKLNEFEQNNLKLLNAFEKEKNDDTIDSPLIRRYMNLLYEQMDNLVIFPLMKANKKFKEYPNEDKEGNKIIKDADLFNYILFVELKNSAELMGSLSEEKVHHTTTTSKSQSAYEASGQLTYNPNEDSPPSKPEDVRVAERKPSSEGKENFSKKAEEFFGGDVKIEDDEEEDFGNIIYEDDDMEILEGEDE